MSKHAKFEPSEITERMVNDFTEGIRRLDDIEVQMRDVVDSIDALRLA